MGRGRCWLTKSLNVVFVPTALDVLHHQARLAYLRVSHHADFYHHAGILLCLLPLRILAVLALALGGRRSTQTITLLILIWGGAAALGLWVGSGEAGV